MNPKVKTIVRRFELQVCGLPLQRCPRLEEVVQSVIDSIETDTVYVLRPDDDEAFCPTTDAQGREVIGGRASIRVKVKEWLPVVCQAVEFSLDEHPQGAAASYANNFIGAILPEGAIRVPPGPAGFRGEIVVYRQTYATVVRTLKRAPKKAVDMLSFVIAHEPVHAIDMMKLVVPAFMNWDEYWATGLCQGHACEDAMVFCGMHAKVLDSYGSDNELARVRDYWPTRAKRWFDAARK